MPQLVNCCFLRKEDQHDRDADATEKRRSEETVRSPSRQDSVFIMVCDIRLNPTPTCFADVYVVKVVPLVYGVMAKSHALE